MRNPKRTSATAAALMIGVGPGRRSSPSSPSSTKASIDADRRRAPSPATSSSTPARFGGGGLSPDLADRARRAARGRGGHRHPHRRRPRSTAHGTTLVAVDPADRRRRSSTSACVDGSLDDLGADGHRRPSTTTAEDHGLAVGDTVPVRFAETGDAAAHRRGHLRRRATWSGDYLVGHGRLRGQRRRPVRPPGATSTLRRRRRRSSDGRPRRRRR